LWHVMYLVIDYMLLTAYVFYLCHPIRSFTASLCINSSYCQLATDYGSRISPSPHRHFPSRDKPRACDREAEVRVKLRFHLFPSRVYLQTSRPFAACFSFLIPDLSTALGSFHCSNANRPLSQQHIQQHSPCLTLSRRLPTRRALVVLPGLMVRRLVTALPP
jgi:hypothetical protein